MPVLANFATTFQWLRELRRWKGGEKLVAVYFRIPDDTPVWVGRFATDHRQLSAAQAARWVSEHPLGAQWIVPRAIAASELEKIWDMTQLVGWTGVPEQHLKWACVCQGCLPAGTPDLSRRLRAAYSDAITALRRADCPQAQSEALLRMEIPLERARKRLSPRRILALAASPHPSVRASLASLMSLFRWEEVEATVLSLTMDPSLLVQQRAVGAVWASRGSMGAARLLLSSLAAIELISLLDYEPDEDLRRDVLRLLSGSAVREVAERARSVAGYC